MEINTSLFNCTVLHGRVKPVRNSFEYRYFMFMLNLDDPSALSSSWLSGFENRRLYTFRNRDHYSLQGRSTAESIRLKFSERGITGSYKLFLLTNLRTAGYQFNPVSFYFAIKEGNILGCIAEVGNTFGEQKLYYPEKRPDNSFYIKTKKEFYVSPYSSLDAEFEFFIKLGKELEIRINTFENESPVLFSRLSGKFESLTSGKLLYYTFRFPLVTIKVITMIHWQAFRIWMKKAPYMKKKENIHLQKDHYIIKE